MTRIVSIGATTEQQPALPSAQALQGTGIGTTSATPSGDPSGDTTTYVTNADGTIDVTTTNGQRQIIETSTLAAPAIAVATNGGGPAPARGALVNQVA